MMTRSSIAALTALAASVVLLLSACGGGGGGAPTVSAPEPGAGRIDDRPDTGRLRFPIDRCDHPRVCLSHHDNVQASLRDTGSNLNGLYDPDADPAHRRQSQRIGLLDSFENARHAPINRGYYLTDRNLIQCSGDTCSFDPNAYTPFVMIGAEQNFTDWGFVGGAPQTRENIASLPVVAAEPRIDIRYGRVNDGAGATELRRFFRQWMQDALEHGYVSPDLGHQALRYRTAPEVRLIGAPTELERREMIAAVQTINSALPEGFRLTIGETMPARSSHENVIAVEYVDLPGSNIRSGGQSVATTDNEYRADGSIASSYVRMSRAVDPNLERHVMLPALVHELAHALGFAGHVDTFLMRSILESGFGVAESFRPLDREALRVLYSRLEPGDAYPFSFGAWASDSLHIHGNTAHAGFGVALRNGYAEPWAYGDLPDGCLADNPALSGTVAWSGTLLGLTPAARSVRGDARLTVNLGTMRGRADFTRLESWAGAPGHTGSGMAWGDGDLRYAVAVSGNAFRETGGDAGRLTGSFTGRNHEGAAGTLERHDLTAAFGASRD